MGAESTIESAVKRYAVEKGFYVRKFKSPAQRGVPDDLFISPDGDVFFIEFKAPGKEPTALQLREARLIQKNKRMVFFIDNIEAGKLVVNNYSK